MFYNLRFYFYFAIVLLPLITYSQVGIGTTTPNNSAMLDITSSNKGILIPRVALVNVTNTTTPVNAPVEGLMVWNTSNGTVGGTGKGFYFFNGTIWVPVNVNSTNTLDMAYDTGGPGAGRTIIADANPVHIGGEDGFIVSGTFGNGNTLDPAYGSLYNSRMFFYPKKAAFRAGYDSFADPDPLVNNQGAWDTDAEIGDYSFATGRYNRASGEASFAANNDNHASGQYSSAFGSDGLASGKASVTFGSNNIASGENAIASGNSSTSSGNNSFTMGSGLQANSFSETVFGSFNTFQYDDLHVPNSTAINLTDRIFSIGIGGGNLSRKNALEIYKNGKIRFNEEYYFPTTDGSAGQVLTTDGIGNVSWVTPHNTNNITNNNLYSEDTALVFNNGVLTDLAGVQTSIFPGAIAPLNGNIQVKLFVLCSTTNIPTAFSLIANDGTTDTTITLVSPTTTTMSGNVLYTTEWSNWDANETLYYKLRLQGQSDGVTNISIGNVYILTRAQ